MSGAAQRRAAIKSSLIICKSLATDSADSSVKCAPSAAEFPENMREGTQEAQKEPKVYFLCLLCSFCASCVRFPIPFDRAGKCTKCCRPARPTKGATATRNSNSTRDVASTNTGSSTRNNAALKFFRRENAQFALTATFGGIRHARDAPASGFRLPCRRSVPRHSQRNFDSSLGSLACRH